MPQQILFNPDIHEDIHVPSYIGSDHLPLLYAQIIDYIYRNGYTILTNQELATRFAVSVKAVRQAVRDMQDKGWLIVSQIVYERGKTGRMMRILGGSRND